MLPPLQPSSTAKPRRAERATRRATCRCVTSLTEQEGFKTKKMLAADDGIDFLKKQTIHALLATFV